VVLIKVLINNVGIMKYAVELGSGAMLCKPGLIKIGSGVHRLLRGNTSTQVGSQSHTEQDDLISLCLLLKIREVGSGL
jgi:hypothetical protein